VSAAAALAVESGAPPVRPLGHDLLAPVGVLLARFGLSLRIAADGAEIPFSYWGESEAGLEGHVVWARLDTPLHSVLHEACHALCMDAGRRRVLARDAGGDYAEEDAVCCLQILLADELVGVGRAALMADMDRWGYTFRLGSAERWFEEESGIPRAWLCAQGLIDDAGRPTWRMRS
jgi:hypothetical protein